MQRIVSPKRGKEAIIVGEHLGGQSIRMAGNCGDEQVGVPRRPSGAASPPAAIRPPRGAGHIVAADWTNVAVLCLCCLCAHFLPYETLICSYALLGPVHYLTEISWLHDRQYFAGTKKLLPAMAAMALLLILPLFGLSVSQPWYGAMIGLTALGIAAAFAVSPVAGVTGFAGAAVVLFLPVAVAHPIAVVLAVFLPTVIHIFVFTGMFMFEGARRNRSVGGFVALGMLVVGAATFVPASIPVATARTGAGAAGVAAFGPLVEAIHAMGVSLDHVVGMLGFLYLQHYLNWMCKVGVIGWGRVSSSRWVTIVLVWVLVMSSYGINFTAGYLVSLFISHLHVLLELPLNLKTLVKLGGGTSR